MTALTESIVEDAALAWLESLGWNAAYGPDIAPDTPDAEPASHQARQPRRYQLRWLSG